MNSSLLAGLSLYFQVRDTAWRIFGHLIGRVKDLRRVTKRGGVGKGRSPPSRFFTYPKSFTRPIWRRNIRRAESRA